MSSSLPDSQPLSKPENYDEPVFQAPWEAKAFAIVTQLVTTQHYSWAEWTEQLAGEIAAAEADPTDTRTYYERWVNACETFLLSKGILESHSIEQKIGELLSEQAHQHVPPSSN